MNISLGPWIPRHLSTQLVIQLAKEYGLKVIASAGSEEKVEFIKSIGANKEGPIDIFWDNVGGDTLNAAIEFAAFNGRFIECGSISGYNTGRSAINVCLLTSKRVNVWKMITSKNWNLINPKCLHINGILVFRLFPKYAEEFYATIPAKLASGEFKYTEDVTKGLENVGDMILAVAERDQ
ncbi:hypothetical protein B0H14DRAFT_3480405 [Mycena olivaceomarginata]|nr:hypothetical protein B0H14DRAFT_3480405 [Mycena olivaceomarginata]